MKLVMALGGNMISDASNKFESFTDQKQRIQHSAEIIADILELGHELIITHGNGPQVGSLLLQQQADVEGSVSLPLNILGALTQGQIGVLLQHALVNELKCRNIIKPVVVLPTSVIVDKNDPGFTDPSKPVGPYYSEEEYHDLEKDPDHRYVKSDTGYRRIVASPQPIDILEATQIDTLSQSNLVIAVGGGGTPTVRTENGIEMKDAVIDKDLASALLATKIDADLLMILTNVDGVYRQFNTDQQELISTLSLAEARTMIEEAKVSRGSMAPKVRAGINFNGTTIITSPELALRSLRGEAGTRINNN